MKNKKSHELEYEIQLTKRNIKEKIKNLEEFLLLEEKTKERINVFQEQIFNLNEKTNEENQTIEDFMKKIDEETQKKEQIKINDLNQINEQQIRIVELEKQLKSLYDLKYQLKV